MTGGTLTACNCNNPRGPCLSIGQRHLSCKGRAQLQAASRRATHRHAWQYYPAHRAPPTKDEMPRRTKLRAGSYARLPPIMPQRLTTSRLKILPMWPLHLSSIMPQGLMSRLKILPLWPLQTGSLIAMASNRVTQPQEAGNHGVLGRGEWEESTGARESEMCSLLELSAPLRRVA